jgi:lipoprotein-anchoring transpeptidase ErfK/SrfK
MRRLAPIGLVAVVAGCGGGAPAARAPEPAPAPRAFTAVKERTAPRPQGRFLTARIVRRVRMRAAPGGRRVGPPLRRRTEFGSPKVARVLERRGGWLLVVVPERANAAPAWIPEAAAKLGAVDVSIRVDRSARRLTVRRGDRVVRRLPVAVGRPGTETPLGSFAVTDKLRAGRIDSPYGCCALALSGHQPKLLPGWPGGDRLAIHATPQADSVGRAASLGCMRAKTQDMRELMRIVPLGAPVRVAA